MKKIIIILLSLISVSSLSYYAYAVYKNSKPSRQALADQMKNKETTKNTADYSKLLQNNM